MKYQNIHIQDWTRKLEGTTWHGKRFIEQDNSNSSASYKTQQGLGRYNKFQVQGEFI